MSIRHIPYCFPYHVPMCRRYVISSQASFRTNQNRVDLLLLPAHALTPDAVSHRDASSCVLFRFHPSPSSSSRAATATTVASSTVTTHLLLFRVSFFPIISVVITSTASTSHTLYCIAPHRTVIRSFVRSFPCPLRTQCFSHDRSARSVLLLPSHRP